ncbi:glycosyltransferase [Piscirickettsia salmonis]|uniref:Glycosyltransferase n=1 Tax=Piscirickettsia salmonis TaxID=1238 RepID=A0A9Q5VHJ1_PISSA|nr:glycosyltransferase [Piscirickettsia salmonis]ALA23585.1 glycosyl transferase 2 family protein [Piscirickettsia salmonis]APS44033.1 hypothetical protein AVI48_06425 [Piscirickettsia salmonis]PEQ15650.1 glycosyl transferase [Piscirickettsia salmonis]QGN78894.1 glycosyltransferase [Piscirickettsia salmonis]QGN82479.1 glycosyltransferase [Piscirickettsia salmonis]
MKKIVIIIPVHNECLCLTRTVRQLQNEIVKVTYWDIRIIIFDSASTDGTDKISQILQKKYNNIDLLTELSKTGLGSAYVQAMRYALDHLQAEIVFEYDADGSHQPCYLIKMLELFDQGADVVVGSRYIQGGSVDSSWPWQRRLVSKFGNFIAGLFLTFRYKDLTSGFRGTRALYLRRFLAKRLLSKDYAYKLQLFWQLHKMRAKIIEYPIHFIDRAKGVSKSPKGNIKDSLKVVALLRLLEIKRYIKMSVAGCASMILQITLYNILHGFTSFDLASLISIECAIVMNFILNNFIVFKDKNYNKERIFFKFIRFNVFSCLSVLIQMIMLHWLHNINDSSLIVMDLFIFISIVLGSVINYFLFSRLIWRVSTK